MSGIESTTPHSRNLSEAERKELDDMVAEDERAAATMNDDNDDDDGAAAGDVDAGQVDAGAAAADAGKAKPPAKDGKAAEGGDDAAAAAAGDAGEGKDGKAGDAAKAGGGEDDAAAAAAAAAAKDGGDAGEDKDQQRVVNGLLNALQKERAKNRAGVKLPELPERDFDAEDTALEQRLADLDKRYDDDGSLTDAEYRAEQRKILTEQRALDRDRGKYQAYELLKERDEAEAKAEQENAQAAWDAAAKEWEDSMGDWIKNPVRRVTVTQVLNDMGKDPTFANLSNEEFLAKANAFLADAFDNFPLRDQVVAKAGAGAATTVTERQRAAARAAASGSSAPPSPNGGVGNRGTTSEGVDLNKLPLGNFKTLSKEEQARQMGVDVKDL